MPASKEEMRKQLLGKEKISKAYKVKDVIALGSQATVKEGLDKKTKEKVAVKVYDKHGDGFDEEELLRECVLMQRCAHEGVVVFKRLYETKKTFELVMEHCNVGEWYDTMILRSDERGDGAPYTEAEAKPVLKQLLGAVDCLHSNKVCHRDLKPENILVVRAAGASQDDIQLKIADFGLAADLAGVEDGKMHESYGSPEYAAPEILKDGPGYGIEVDLWSLGVIVFMMLSGVLPFSADDLGTMRRKVQNQSVDICFRQTAEQWAQVSAEGQAFVRSLLVKEPQSRTPCAKLLTSEWIDPEAFRVAKEEAEAAAAKAAEEAAMIAAAEADFEEGDPPESASARSANRASFGSSHSRGSSDGLTPTKRTGSFGSSRAMFRQGSYVGCELPEGADIILAVDIGTTGTKAVLSILGRSHEELATAYEQYTSGTATDSTGACVDQQPVDWWNAFIRVSRKVLNASGACGAEPRLGSLSIVLSGQMQDMILVSAEKPEGIRPAILYSDSRAKAQAARLEATVGKDVLTAKTGNYKGATSCIAKWLWLQEEAVEDFASAEAVLLGAHGYVAWRLCGQVLCDYTTASTTGLLDKESCIAGNPQWCFDLLAEAGIERAGDLLPALVPAAHVCSRLSEEVVSELGLEWGEWSHDSHLISGCGDLGSATVGAGGGTEGTSYAYLGTSGWIAQTMSPKSAAANPLLDGVFELLHPDPTLVIRAASMLNSGGAVEWLAETDYHGTGDAPHEIYPAIDSIARTAPPGSNGVIFLPYLSGERCPMSDPLARGVYFGMSRSSGKPERYRATLEGVAFSYKSLLRLLCPDASPAKLLLVGGGSNSSVWAQILADVLDVVIEVRGGVGSQDVGARGSAILAETVLVPEDASLELPSQEQEQDEDGRGGFIVHRYSPNPAYRELYDATYSIYTGLYQALKPSFEAAGQLPALAATGREAAEAREKSLRTSVGPPASEPEPVSSETEASLRTSTYGPKVSSQDVDRPSGAVSSI